MMRPPTITPEEWAKMRRPSPWPTPAQVRQWREPRYTTTPSPEVSDLDRDVQALNDEEGRQFAAALEESKRGAPDSAT